mgnify:CR=1 FL=1
MTTPTLFFFPLQVDRRAVQRALPALRGQAAHQAEGVYAEAAEGAVSTLDTSEAAARLSLLREAMAAALRLEANKQQQNTTKTKASRFSPISHTRKFFLHPPTHFSHISHPTFPHISPCILVFFIHIIEYQYTSLGRFSCFCTSLVVAGCLARRARLR